MQKALLFILGLYLFVEGFKSILFPGKFGPSLESQEKWHSFSRKYLFWTGKMSAWSGETSTKTPKSAFRFTGLIFILLSIVAFYFFFTL
jgi:hypothetical protein